MPYLVRLSDRSLRDLEAIYRFIQADASQIAFAWFNALAETIYNLERFPQRGTRVSKTRRLRQILFGKKPNTYRIIFAVDKRRRIVNVLHIRHATRAELLSE